MLLACCAMPLASCTHSREADNRAVRVSSGPCVDDRMEAKVAREAKLFVFELTDREAAELKVPVGSGGHQSLHRRLLEQLEQGNTVTFTDQQLGALIRYMTQYEQGGFQGRLRKAFDRSLRKQLGF